jgi:hypothetical protein
VQELRRDERMLLKRKWEGEARVFSSVVWKVLRVVAIRVPAAGSETLRVSR